jgi:hypothetical protein
LKSSFSVRLQLMSRKPISIGTLVLVLALLVQKYKY